MLSIVKSILGTKQIIRFTENSLNLLAVLIVEAFINSVTTNVTQSWSPNIRCQSILGELMESHTLQGILLDFGLPHESPKTLNNISVILFNISLMPTEIEEKDTQNYKPVSKSYTIQLQTQSQYDEISQLKLIGEKLLSLKVNVVASQKLIHPFLKRLLLDNVQNYLII